MKRILILLCLPLIGFGQTWKYRSGGNDFDGKYRTSIVTGTGDDWPYDSPQLVVNYWEDSKNLNLYISKAGYYIYDSGTKVYLSFSNENEMVYVCNDLSYSSDNEQVFMGDFYLRDNYNEAFDKIEIIEKLMNASYVNIRISNDYGKNTMKFSLRGSTKAIKFVIPDIESRLKEDEVEIENELEVEDTDTDENDFIEQEEEDDFDEVFMVVEVMPQFSCLKFKDIVDKDGRITNVTLVRGVDRDFDAEGAKEYCGDLGLMKFIQKTVRYPHIAKENDITGKVYVTYVVNKKGKVTNVKVARGVDKYLDAEAVRVVKLLSYTTAGTQRGKSVNVQYTIPINFILN